MDVRTRHYVVSKHKYCVNCLAKSHDLRDCPSRDTCQRCGNYHHTLLHPGIRSRLDKKKPKRGDPRRSPPRNHHRRPPSTSHHHVQPSNSSVPNQRIISEAIRSLAQVLCVQPTTPPPGGRNV